MGIGNGYAKQVLTGMTLAMVSLAGIGCAGYQVTYEATGRINNCGMPEGRETQPFEVVLVMPGDPDPTDAIYTPRQWFKSDAGIDQSRIFTDSIRRNEIIERTYDHPEPGEAGSGIMIIPNYLDPSGDCTENKRSLWYPTDGFMTSKEIHVIFDGTTVRLKR